MIYVYVPVFRDAFGANFDKAIECFHCTTRHAGLRTRLEKCIFPRKLVNFAKISFMFLCIKRTNFPPNS